jgi:hypothetical protein
MNLMRSAGFTIIEILLVTALIGAVAAIIIPRIGRRTPQHDWPVLLDKINHLASIARQESLMHHNVYRLVFAKGTDAADAIYIEEEYLDDEKPGMKRYREPKVYYSTTRYEFGQGLWLNGFYQGKENLLSERKAKAYCYIIPDGMMQECMVKIAKKLGEQEFFVTLTANPFEGKFEFDEGSNAAH